MLQNIKVKTVDNESISVKDVYYIGFGERALNDKLPFPTEHRNQLIINCERGIINFPLNNIKSIEFSIVNEKNVIMVASNYKDETKKGTNSGKRKQVSVKE